jgi:hypothetical protein
MNVWAGRVCHERRCHELSGIAGIRRLGTGHGGIAVVPLDVAARWALTCHAWPAPATRRRTF